MNGMLFCGCGCGIELPKLADGQRYFVVRDGKRLRVECAMKLAKRMRLPAASTASTPSDRL